MERLETVLPLDFVEVRVDFVAKVGVGLVQIERKRLELFVAPGVPLGLARCSFGFASLD